MKNAVIGAAVGIFSLTVAADEETAQSRRYVQSLSGNCSYVDGYRCAEPAGPGFTGPGVEERLVGGALLSAWQVTWEDFRANEELIPEQRQLRHYRIGFGEDDSNYLVLYRALPMPRMVAGQPQGIISVPFGRTTVYEVDKATLRIVRRRYMR